MKNPAVSSSMITLAALLSLPLGPAVTMARSGQPPSSGSGPSTIQEQVSHLPKGSVIEIVLANDEKFRARLVSTSDGCVVVQWLNRDKIEDRKISFSEIRSAEPVLSRPSRLKTWGRYALVGGLGGAVGIAELAREDRP